MTGAAGGMGQESFKQMLPDLGKNYELLILVRDSEKNHALFDEYAHQTGLTIVYGDLLDKPVVGARNHADNQTYHGENRE